MKFKQYLENISNNLYNKQILTNLVRRLSSGGLFGRDIEISPEEVSELVNVTNAARDYIVKVLQSHPHLATMFNQYQQWEKTNGASLTRFTFPNSVVQNGGNIPNIQATDEKIILPKDVYTLIHWQVIGKGLRQLPRP